jgi:hypothetical protein
MSDNKKQPSGNSGNIKDSSPVPPTQNDPLLGDISKKSKDVGEITKEIFKKMNDD